MIETPERPEARGHDVLTEDPAAVPAQSGRGSPVASPAPATAPHDEERTPGVRAAIERGAEQLRATDAERTRMRAMRFDTIAVHGLYNMAAALANQGSVNEPAVLSPAQHFASSDDMEAALAYLAPSWTYSRISNPTLTHLEETLALLEGYGIDDGVSATVMSSGMAAVMMATNPFLTLDPSVGGDRPRPNLVASARCYGGTFMLFNRYAAERGIELRWVADALDPAAWAAAVDEGTRVVFGEMPSNPGLGMFDIAAVASVAHGVGAPLVVDSTVATPALMRPLEHGADVVVHSLSKAIGGSGMAIAGAVVARHGITSNVGSDDLRDDFALHVKLQPMRDMGPGLSPFNGLLVLSDLRTLRTRMDQWSRNAMAVARWLEGDPRVLEVRYPGLESFPGHDLSRRYLTLVDGDGDGSPAPRFGHLLSFRVAGGHEATRAAFDRLRLIWRATDLGRVKSIATIPAISTHQQQGEAGRELADIPADLVRLSVGGEHPDDVIADLDQALG